MTIVRNMVVAVLVLSAFLLLQVTYHTSQSLVPHLSAPDVTVVPRVGAIMQAEGKSLGKEMITLAALKAKHNIRTPTQPPSPEPAKQPSPPQAPQMPPPPPKEQETEPAADVRVPCPRRTYGPSSWRQVPSGDLLLMDNFGAPSGISSCFMLDGAMFLTLDFSKVQKAEGFAFSLDFPDYIVADEPSKDWRSRRSTLQLFVQSKAGSIKDLQPLGPAHTKHNVIASRGNGAFSHWRHRLTDGPSGSSSLRFSTPGNVPLAKLKGIIAVAYLMSPPMGWVEFPLGKRVGHQEVFRELFLRTFPTVGVAPHLVDTAEATKPGTRYLWRVGGNGEFELPLKPGELYEKQMPYQIAEWYGQFEKHGGILFPPPESYVYYQNKVALARLFQKTHVKTPATWVFESLDESLQAAAEVKLPVVIKDPYGFSSLGIQQAATEEEYKAAMRRYFENALPGVEAIVQSKVLALREARVTYIDGRPFHGYWRVRKSINSASAASNMGGYQDFSFPLEDIAPHVAQFANATGVPVGGVDFIWEQAEPDVKSEPFTLEVSPTSDINPPSPPSWTGTYADFKHTPGYHNDYLGVRRQWTDLMVLATIDRYRRERRHLFVDIDNVVSLSAARVLKWRGGKEAYSSAEVMQDVPVADAKSALRKLRKQYFIRFLTARGGYQDAFNVTRSWLNKHNFEYDELIVVATPEAKVAHLTEETILVDDFTLGHESPKPFPNTKFMEQLTEAKLPFVVFPLGGSWADVLPQLIKHQ